MSPSHKKVGLLIAEVYPRCSSDLQSWGGLEKCHIPPALLMASHTLNHSSSILLGLLLLLCKLLNVFLPSQISILPGTNQYLRAHNRSCRGAIGKIHEHLSLISSSLHPHSFVAVVEGPSEPQCTLQSSD